MGHYAQPGVSDWKERPLGIIGLGNIGKNVARKAEAFGMNIIYYNHHTEVPGYRRVELDTLLRESDFVTLHTPLTPATRHLIGQRELSLMKPTAFFLFRFRVLCRQTGSPGTVR